MSILENLSDKYSIDAFMPASSEQDIRQLCDKSSVEIPDEYLEVIREKSEIEICVSGRMYIRIWGADGCIEMNEAYNIQKYLPNSLAFGDDEGGGALIYMSGKEGFGMYLCRFADLDIDEAIKISPSLRELLVWNVGIDKLV